MRTLIVTLAFLTIMSIVTSRAVADQDGIGPLTAVAGQPIDLFFPNHVLPPPSRKVMSFTGMAEAFGPPGIAAILGIHFDYIDPNNPTGPPVVVPSPNFYMEAVQTGAGLVPINAGPVVLPFCPEQVSIHFENLTPNTEIDFTGIFDHTCVPIPEPATLALIVMSGLASIGGRRLRA